MTSDRETTRIVRSWLGVEEYESADRVLDVVLDRLATTPQRRSLWQAWRFPNVSNFMKIAVAAIVLVAVVAAGFALGNTGIGGPAASPTPSPSPTVAPTPAPTPTLAPTPSPEQLVTGSAGPGRYTFGVGPVNDAGDFECCGGRYFQTELTLPEGWEADSISSAEVGLGGPDGQWLGFFAVQRIYKDPCHPEDGYQGSYALTPSNAQDAVNELTNLIGFEAGPEETSTIDGLPTTHFPLSNDIDAVAEECTDGNLLPLFMTLEADKQAELSRRTHSPATNGGTTEQVWVVNRDLYPLLIVGEFGSDEQTGRHAIEEILASIALN
jgi:hypothetical protein